MKQVVKFLLLTFLLIQGSVLIPNEPLDPTPYILPEKDSLRILLDSLFKSPGIIANEKTLKTAGFKILRAQKYSGIRLVQHPKLKGYLLKIYLESETRRRNGLTGEQWLIQRCIGASAIRKIIAQNKMRYFTVPDKWLYRVLLQNGTSSTFVLVVTDMKLVQSKETKKAWKTKATKEVLDELFIILSQGYGSTGLRINIPYTKNGTFALIDTEFQKRTFTLSRVNSHLSPKMREYWNSLINSSNQDRLTVFDSTIEFRGIEPLYR